MSITEARYDGWSDSKDQIPGPDTDTAIMLGPFNGFDGVDATPEELRIYRSGELVETISGPLIEQRAGVLDPYAGAPGFAWAAEVASHFPEDVFCFAEPVSFDLYVRLGTHDLDEELERAGTSVRAFYDPTLFESFDGELKLERLTRGRENLYDGGVGRLSVLPAGYANGVCGDCSQQTLVGGFREWRKDVADLDDHPVHKRRIVQVSLPAELSAHEEDLVLAHRVAGAVCELVRLYVETGGARISHEAGRIDNLFAGGMEEGPLPRRSAPALYGRSIKDVYRRAGLSAPWG